MKIEETSEEIEKQKAHERMLAEQAKLKEQELAGKEGYKFQPLDIGHPGIFPNFKSKETQEKFYQW